MTLKLSYKPSYGQARFYPHDERSRLLMGLIQKKCLSEAEVNTLKMIGFEVEVMVNDELLNKVLKGSK